MATVLTIANGGVISEWQAGMMHEQKVMTRAHLSSLLGERTGDPAYTDASLVRQPAAVSTWRVMQCSALSGPQHVRG